MIAVPSGAGLPAHIALNPRALSIAEGLRAALSTALIVGLNEWFHSAPVMVAALGAWLTCMGDAGGAIRTRVPALLTFGVLGAAITMGFGLLGAAPQWVLVPIAATSIFFTSFARVWGPAAMQAGNLLTVTLVLALRGEIKTVAEAATLGGAFLAGSLWALLVTMVVWRIYPHLPARRAVADCYRALASLTVDLRASLRASPGQDDIWDRHARAHRRTVRDAIENARTAVLATVRTRNALTGRSAQTWVRLETADQIFGALIGLSEILSSTHDPATLSSADRILRRLRPVLTLIADYIVSDRPDRLTRLETAVSDMLAEAPTGSPLHFAAVRIADRTRIAITLAAPTETLLGLGGTEPRRPVWLRVWGPVRANLDWSSEILRHALRIAVVSIPAATLTLQWSSRYGYWLMITLVMTMQPYFAPTFTRALERIGGTVLGGLVAAAVAVVCTTPASLAIAIFPLSIIAFSLRQVSFGLFIAGITPIVILLVELNAPGESEVSVALIRSVYTLAGGALAVIGSFLLWPSWEPGRLVKELRGAIAAHGAYARTEIEMLLGEADEDKVEHARRAAGLASNNVEASLQRALLEPHREAALEPALTIDAALRRMAGRLSALQVEPGEGHDPAIWHLWRDWIDATMHTLAESGGTEPPPRPQLPAGDRQADALERLGRQIDLVAGALRRIR